MPPLFSLRRISLLYLAVCGAFFVYYSLLTMMLVFIRLLQVFRGEVTLSTNPSAASQLSPLDIKIDSWYRFGIFLCAGFTTFHSVNIMVITNECFHRQPDNFKRVFFYVLSLNIAVVIMAQYTWAIEGGRLYFGELNYGGQLYKLHLMANAMLIILAVNQMDMVRNLGIVVMCLVIHCWCKKRAR